MKFTVTLEIDNEDDTQEIKHLVNYRDNALLIYEIDNICRSAVKYGEEELCSKSIAIFEEIRDAIVDVNS